MAMDALRQADPEVWQAVEAERRRQQDGLEMIASENYTSPAVLAAQGSVLTNKYAEGYPGRRYYGGCEHVDVVEQLAIDRLKELFGAEYANVQPHSGAQANAAAMSALLEPGDTILGLDLAHGGHLTHGMKLNFSGKLYDVAAYHVSREDHRVDMAEVEKLALERRPKLIIAGWSAYPRRLDFAAFRRIADEVGAYFMVDMAHFAGLVAAGLHPSPVPHAHVVTSTTHKTLGGPRGGFILATADLGKKFSSSVFPGQQGGPLEHVIAAKAVAFKLAGEPAFAERQERTLAGARLLAERLLAPDSRAAGVNVVSGGTDVHLVLADLRESALDGRQAEFLWRNPDPKPGYDVVIVGGGGHGLATAHYLAKNHGITNVAILERGWLAGGNVARNTTIIRSNYLWDATSAIYEHSLRLWESLEEDLGYPILFSQRGVLNLAHSLQDVRDSVRRVEANKLNGIDAEWLDPDQVRKICPIVNTSADIRYPVLGATYQPRAGIAKHDYVAWGFARRADQA